MVTDVKLRKEAAELWKTKKEKKHQWVWEEKKLPMKVMKRMEGRDDDQCHERGGGGGVG